MKKMLKRRLDHDSLARSRHCATPSPFKKRSGASAALSIDVDPAPFDVTTTDDEEEVIAAGSFLLDQNSEPPTERALFERRRNFIARAGLANDKEALRLLMADCTGRHIKSALYRVIDDPDAIKAICKAATTGRLRLHLAGRTIYRAASRLHTGSTFALVAFASDRRAKAVAEALARLIDDDEAEPIECLFTACAAVGSGVSQHKRNRWACDALYKAAAQGRPTAAEALAREVHPDDIERVIAMAAARDEGDVVANLFDACADLVAYDTRARWTLDILCDAAEREHLSVIDHLMDIARPTDVREALLRCAGPRRRVDAFERMWEYADACVHEFIQRLPEGVGRDHLYDLIDDDVGCEGYCNGTAAVDQDSTKGGDDDGDDDDNDGERTVDLGTHGHRRLPLPLVRAGSRARS